jgi:Rhodanese-like domain
MNRRAIVVAVAISLCALVLAGLAATRSHAVAKPEVQAAMPANQSLPALVSPRTTLESIPRVTPAALKEKIERGEVVVLDVRDIDSYTASHIPGALHIPLSYIESELPYLPRSKPIVTYCT